MFLRERDIFEKEKRRRVVFVLVFVSLHFLPWPPRSRCFFSGVSPQKQNKESLFFCYCSKFEKKNRFCSLFFCLFLKGKRRKRKRTSPPPFSLSFSPSLSLVCLIYLFDLKSFFSSLSLPFYLKNDFFFLSGSSPASLIVTFFAGAPEGVPCASMALTTSIPSNTSPKTTCLPSSQEVTTVVMKNWGRGKEEREGERERGEKG